MTGEEIIVGLESTCDETACAVVVGGRRVLANVVATQIDLHARFGGVVPEIASRAHLEAVNTVIEQALGESGVSPADVSAVAVAHEPGLIGSLLISLMAAKTLAWVWGVPLIGVNHVHAHAYAPALDDEPIAYPAVALIASGGHTSLYLARSPLELELLGATVDDAAGEAFDKVAAVLELGYPGGPAVDRAAGRGNPKAVAFPRALLKGQSLDFSFSGLKTAVLYHVRGTPGAVRDGAPDGPRRLSDQDVADVAAGFQAAVVDTLRIKLRRAAEATGAATLIIGGGVAANSALRSAVEKLGRKIGATVRMPAMACCVDNAAMTAGLAWHRLAAGAIDDLTLAATATMRR